MGILLHNARGEAWQSHVSQKDNLHSSCIQHFYLLLKIWTKTQKKSKCTLCTKVKKNLSGPVCKKHDHLNYQKKLTLITSKQIFYNALDKYILQNNNVHTIFVLFVPVSMGLGAYIILLTYYGQIQISSSKSPLIGCLTSLSCKVNSSHQFI